MIISLDCTGWSRGRQAIYQRHVRTALVDKLARSVRCGRACGAAVIKRWVFAGIRANTHLTETAAKRPGPTSLLTRLQPCKRVNSDVVTRLVSTLTEKRYSLFVID